MLPGCLAQFHLVRWVEMTRNADQSMALICPLQCGWNPGLGCGGKYLRILVMEVDVVEFLVERWAPALPSHQSVD